MVFRERGSFRRYKCIPAWTRLAHPTVGWQRSGGRDSFLVVIIYIDGNLNKHYSTPHATHLLYATTHLSVLSSSLFSSFFKICCQKIKLLFAWFCDKTKPICVAQESSNKEWNTWQPVSSDSPSVSKNKFLTGSLNTSVQHRSRLILWSMDSFWHYQRLSFGGLLLNHDWLSRHPPFPRLS